MINTNETQIGDKKMKHQKCFALVAQKKEGDDFEIIFTHQFRCPVMEEEIKTDKKDWNSTFISKLFSDTITYQDGWIKKFNAERNANIKWNKINGF